MSKSKIINILTIPKDICSWNCDQRVYITKLDIKKDKLTTYKILLLYKYEGYNIYYKYKENEYGCIRPYFLFGDHYILKYINEILLENNIPYPELMIEYFFLNNIIIPKKFNVKKFKI